MNYRVSLRIKRNPPMFFQETSLPFPAAEVPSCGARRTPVPPGTQQSHRLPADTRGQRTLTQLLDQGLASSNSDGSQLKYSPVSSSLLIFFLSLASGKAFPCSEITPNLRMAERDLWCSRFP